MAKKKCSKMSEKLKGRNGITLIALVITIIVWLILAGVTIASITGENGILSKATQASQKTTQEKEREEIKMAVTSDNMKYITGDERESEDYIENFQKELDNIAGTGKTIVEDDMVGYKVTYKETGNEYYIEYEYDEKINIKTSEEYLSDKKYETSDLTNEEKSQLESGIKLETNSGNKGEFLMQIGYDGIVDWGDGTYSKVENPYTGKIENHFKKIASIDNTYSDIKLNSIKIAGTITGTNTIWHQYVEKNRKYIVKVYTSGIQVHSEELLKIVDWGQCELHDVNFSDSTNLAEIAVPQKYSFEEYYGYMAGCFKNCTSLKQIPADFFTNIPEIFNVKSMFENCTSLTGNAIELWKNNKVTSYENCYKGCTNLSNYNEIPEGWK